MQLPGILVDVAWLSEVRTHAGLAVVDVRWSSKGGTSQATVAGESYEVGGDVIVAVDGKAVTSTEALRDTIAAHKPGDRLTLTLYRGTKKTSVTVELGRQPASPPR